VIKRERIFEELQDPTKLILPYSFDNTIETVIVRHLEMKDMQALIPMIVREFGTSLKDLEFFWKKRDIKFFVELWFDRLIFPWIVRVSLVLKIERQRDGDNVDLPNIFPDHNIFCLENASKEVVGMVELSKQPLDPNMNPGPMPVPMLMKNAYCKYKRLPPPNAWVTNLLIGEEYRGRGYSKTLMKAVEGLAKRWEFDTIYLHVDSDTQNGGRIPQNLYQRLGYRPVEKTTDENETQEDDFSWMSNSNFQSGVYMVEGVPLLFMRRELS